MPPIKNILMGLLVEAEAFANTLPASERCLRCKHCRGIVKTYGDERLAARRRHEAKHKTGLDAKSSTVSDKQVREIGSVRLAVHSAGPQHAGVKNPTIGQYHLKPDHGSVHAPMRGRSEKSRILRSSARHGRYPPGERTKKRGSEAAPRQGLVERSPSAASLDDHVTINDVDLLDSGKSASINQNAVGLLGSVSTRIGHPAAARHDIQTTPCRGSHDS